MPTPSSEVCAQGWDSRPVWSVQGGASIWRNDAGCSDPTFGRSACPTRRRKDAGREAHDQQLHVALAPGPSLAMVGLGVWSSPLTGCPRPGPVAGRHLARVPRASPRGRDSDGVSQRSRGAMVVHWPDTGMVGEGWPDYGRSGGSRAAPDRSWKVTQHVDAASRVSEFRVLLRTRGGPEDLQLWVALVSQANATCPHSPMAALKNCGGSAARVSRTGGVHFCPTGLYRAHACATRPFAAQPTTASPRRFTDFNYWPQAPGQGYRPDGSRGSETSEARTTAGATGRQARSTAPTRSAPRHPASSARPLASTPTASPAGARPSG